MIRYTLFFSMFLLSAFSLSGQETQMDLQEAIQYALQNNPSLDRAQINISDAQEQIVERRAIGLPQINATLEYQYFIDIPTQILPDFISPSIYGVLFEEGLVEPFDLMTDPNGQPAQFGTKHNLSAGISLNTMIFDGSYFVGLKAAQTYRDYVAKQLDSERFNVEKQVVEAFLPALLIQTNLNTLQKNIGNLEALYQETSAMYKEGFVEQLDVDRLELSLANLQTEYEKLDRQKSVVVNGLKMVMGYPMDADLVIEGTIEALLEETATIDLSETANVAVRPEYQVASFGKTLNELNIKLNKSEYLPKLYAFGSYQASLYANELSTGQWFPTSLVGLRLQVPIFDGLNKKAKVQRTKLDLEVAQSQIAELEQYIYFEVENARIAYLNASETVGSRRKNLDLANRIYETTQIKYREGVGSSLEMNQAEQSLFTSQQNYNQALYDLLVAKMDYEKAMGR
ncbi:MAG: TolC family protein [Saprospiraceae bacterium]|nr:TolC family protein [Saprospiraceae bacterium]